MDDVDSQDDTLAACQPYTTFESGLLFLGPPYEILAAVKEILALCLCRT